MKAYKLEILIIDTDELGLDNIKSVIENQRFPNWCITPEIESIEEADIGEWSDEHPLNKHDQRQAEYERLFGPFNPLEKR